MQEIVKRRATYAELEAVPPHFVAEILFGDLVTHPRPHRRHSRAAARIMSALGGPFDLGIGGPGGWEYYDEPELHLGPHVVVPDVAAWRSGRLIDTPQDLYYITTPPDWVCEVLSPSTEKEDRVDKRQIYADFGVGHYWLIDPRSRLLEIFALKEGHWFLAGSFAADDAVVAPPFEACTFPLSHFLPAVAVPEGQ
jgi:Uma2 family endonuclease